VLGRGVSEDFLVTRWRRSNRPYTRSNRPLWTASFRGVSAVVGACVLKLLVEFVPRTSSTPVATWCWQTEGRSAERVIFGGPTERVHLVGGSISFEKNFYRLPFTPPLSGRLISPSHGSTFSKHFTFHFQIQIWYMKCLCDKKELMPLHKMKQEG
jgi:hypothetical protein